MTDIPDDPPFSRQWGPMFPEPRVPRGRLTVHHLLLAERALLARREGLGWGQVAARLGKSKGTLHRLCASAIHEALRTAPGP